MRLRDYRVATSRGLAAAMLGEPWNVDAAFARAFAALQPAAPWLRQMITDVFRDLDSPTPPSLHRLAVAIREHEAFCDATCGEVPHRIRRWSVTPDPTKSGRDFADLRGVLRLTQLELDWFCDPRRLNTKVDEGPLRHYRFRWVPKRSEGYRLLETPKPRLKRLQRIVLEEILRAVAPSPFAHGFVPGHSAATYAQPHAGRELVIRVDLEDFFASISCRRVASVFEQAGWQRPAAWYLARLACVDVPESVLRTHPGCGVPRSERARTIARLRSPHLPQGAPTSPAVSNLVARALDRRLSRLADSVGFRYTRYADDLAFSGQSKGPGWVTRFLGLVAAIASDEGLRVRMTKTRVMYRRGRQDLAGLVVNKRPQVRRDHYDELRAILHNCARFGPQSQNRHGVPDFRAHLRGRIASVAATNPRRGQTLLAVFHRIDWPSP